MRVNTFFYHGYFYLLDTPQYDNVYGNDKAQRNASKSGQLCLGDNQWDVFTECLSVYCSYSCYKNSTKPSESKQPFNVSQVSLIYRREFTKKL
jgi:hypothetical protein